jgi:hypothetical protein
LAATRRPSLEAEYLDRRSQDPNETEEKKKEVEINTTSRVARRA